MKALPYLLFFGFVGYLFVSNANRGNTVRTQASTIASQHDTIILIRSENGTLIKKVVRLQRDSVVLTSKVLQLENTNANASTEVYKSIAEWRHQNWLRSRENARLSATEKKAGADRYAGGVGTVPTSVADTLMNEYTKALKDIVTNRDSIIIPGLIRELSVKTSQADSEKRARQSEQAAYQNFRVAISNVKEDVRDMKARASKGIIKRVFNAGKIKGYGEIDEKLSSAQKSDGF